MFQDKGVVLSGGAGGFGNCIRKAVKKAGASVCSITLRIKGIRRPFVLDMIKMTDQRWSVILYLLFQYTRCTAGAVRKGLYGG